MSKIKMLWYSDSPCAASGFGTVARGILDHAVVSRKYDITVLGINHWFPWYDTKRHPYPIWAAQMNPQRDSYGMSMLHKMLQAEDWDIFFSLQDLGIAAYINKAVKAAREAGIKEGKRKHFKWVHYMPIDTGWVWPQGAEFLREIDQLVLYTQFAKDVLEKALPGIEAEVIPHGCDTDTFFPLPEEKRAAARLEYFDLPPERFMVMVVARNQWRKDLVRSMVAFKEFKTVYGRDAVLYLHSKVHDEGGNLIIQAQGAGLDLKEDVIFVPPDFKEVVGHAAEDLNQMYNCADVVFSTALGEGWGLPMTEAFCCKTPVLMPRNTSHIEIIGAESERGWFCEPGGWVVPYGFDETIRPVTDTSSAARQLNAIREAQGTPEYAQRILSAYDWASEHTWGKIWARHWSRVLTL